MIAEKAKRINSLMNAFAKKTDTGSVLTMKNPRRGTYFGRKAEKTFEKTLAIRKKT